MKKLLLLGVSFVFISTQMLDAKTERYEVESGIVHYTISGGGNIMGMRHESHGKKTLYFDEYGNVEVQEVEETSSTMGRTDRAHRLTKIEDKMIYSVDFKRKIITKQDISALMQGKNMSKMGKAMLKEMGGKKTGHDKVLGYDCEVWEVMGSRIWLYKGVPLKTVSNIMGMSHKEEATEAKFGVSIPSDKLKLPDYPTQTAEEMIQREMGQPDESGEGLNPEEIKQMQEMMKGMFGGKK
jgi:hypothetical protein